MMTDRHADALLTLRRGWGLVKKYSVKQTGQILAKSENISLAVLYAHADINSTRIYKTREISEPGESGQFGQSGQIVQIGQIRQTEWIGQIRQTGQTLARPALVSLVDLWENSA